MRCLQINLQCQRASNRLKYISTLVEVTEQASDQLTVSSETVLLSANEQASNQLTVSSEAVLLSSRLPSIAEGEDEFSLEDSDSDSSVDTVIEMTVSKDAGVAAVADTCT